MDRVVLALRTFFRVALPYFRSEDRRMACLLLAAVVAAELALVYVAVAIINWNARFYNALERRDWNAFYAELLAFCFIVARLRSCGRLAILFRADPADPLAALAHRELRLALDGGRPALPRARRGAQCRQHPSAHRQRRLSLHPAHP